MEASYSLISSSVFPSSFGSPLHQKTKLHHGKRSRHIGLSRKRDAYDRDSGGRLVDENMIVLRKRIHEMKVAEGSYEAPSEWMDWEKRSMLRKLWIGRIAIGGDVAGFLVEYSAWLGLWDGGNHHRGRAGVGNRDRVPFVGGGHVGSCRRWCIISDRKSDRSVYACFHVATVWCFLSEKCNYLDLVDAEKMNLSDA